MAIDRGRVAGWWIVLSACGDSPPEGGESSTADPSSESSGPAMPDDDGTDDGPVDSGSTDDGVDPDTGDGGDSSTGDVPVDEPCGTGEWTCVPVEPTGPYGSQTFDVPAAQNWVNTGLFLRSGEQATIDESGAWTVDMPGAAIDHGTCLVGDLVARVDLNYKDPQLTCVHGEGVLFTAPRDGILYVGALTDNDLGETYESRRNASGAKTVTVTSEGDTAPSVEATEAASYPFASVASGRVEIRGTHTIATLPAGTAGQDAAALASALARIDEIYELHEDLRGAVPHHGQRIRFIADPDVVPIGYMLAGNPVRMDPILVDPGFANRISLAGMPGVDVWGFAHELGHDFTFVNGLWWYQENSLESWPNVFTIHALESLGVTLVPEAAACPGGAPVPYASWDAWAGLCFLMQFQYANGWEFYASYFAELNVADPATVPGGMAAWNYVHDRFEAIAGSDVTPTFVAWGVPNPG